MGLFSLSFPSIVCIFNHRPIPNCVYKIGLLLLLFSILTTEFLNLGSWVVTLRYHNEINFLRAAHFYTDNYLDLLP